MVRKVGRLNASAATREREPGLYPDGDGLYLQVTRSGARSWIFRFCQNGRTRDMGLGSVSSVPLAEARKTAAQCRLVKSQGFDPIEVRRKKRKEARRGRTFKDCALTYIESHRPSWRNEKHAEQWRSTFERYVYPVLGDVSVHEIDTDRVMKVLKPIWRRIPSTSARVLGRIEAVLDWASAEGVRDGNNPARWRNHIENLLPRPASLQVVKHHRALPYREIGAFISRLHEQGGTAALALEFLIYTAARTSETLNARWNEVDLENRLWTIPVERMKARREHRVPLSEPAVALLKSLPRTNSGFVFDGRRRGKPLSNMAMLALLRGMGRTDITVHGFRSTFRDWGAEQTSHAHEALEMALAHAVGNKVEAAYRRGDLFEKRKKLMEDWAAHCVAVPVATGILKAA